MDFSIVIPTYNGAKRLPEVLDSLLSQVGTEEIEWEVLVVDNNSKDETAEVVSNYVQKWRKDSQLRYLFEGTQGQAYARHSGVQAASSSSPIGFLDDDNIPADNWVAEACAFGRSRPEVGAYGGIIHGKVDKDPPPYFNQVGRYLTIYNRGEKAFQYKRNAKPRRIPSAPGVVIRKQAWQDAMPSPEKLLITGRDEKTMVSGEDAEMMYRIQNTKWEVWHNPKMEIWHHMPPHRLEKAYLLKLARGYGLSNHQVRLARYYPWQRPLVQLAIPFYSLRDSLRVLNHYIKYKDVLEDDFGKACELQVKIGMLYSHYLGIYSYWHNKRGKR